MKRIICFILALALLSCFCTAFAAGTPTIVVDKVSAKAGDTVKVNISLKNNPGIASMKLKVSFGTAMTLTAVDYNSAMGGQTQQPQTMTSPVTLNWFNGTANTTGDKVFATLTFKVGSKAKGANAITVTYNADDVYNINEDNINFAIENGSITVNAAVKGDVNGDGHIDNTDLVNIARYVVGLTSGAIKTAVEKNADMNGDGHVDNTDLVTVARIIVEQ